MLRTIRGSRSSGFTAKSDNGAVNGDKIEAAERTQSIDTYFGRDQTREPRRRSRAMLVCQSSRRANAPKCLLRRIRRGDPAPEDFP